MPVSLRARNGYYGHFGAILWPLGSDQVFLIAKALQ